MSNEVKTEIMHAFSEGVRFLTPTGWKVLCDGHGDARLTGGVWMYKGDKEEAHRMQQERWKEIKACSDRYYSQCWV